MTDHLTQLYQNTFTNTFIVFEDDIWVSPDFQSQAGSPRYFYDLGNGDLDVHYVSIEFNINYAKGLDVYNKYKVGTETYSEFVSRVVNELFVRQLPITL